MDIHKGLIPNRRPTTVHKPNLSPLFMKWLAMHLLCLTDSRNRDMQMAMSDNPETTRVHIMQTA